MSIKYLETKSETGRSGLRVEFDATTDIVKLSGFYDTYVKLHLKKNEWKLQDFLEYLGITDILEKKNNKLKYLVKRNHLLLKVKQMHLRNQINLEIYQILQKKL